MPDTAATPVNITAQPQERPDQCVFQVDRTLYAGTLYVSDPEYAREWAPVVAAVLDVGGVKGVRVTHGELLVTMVEAPGDWRDTARRIGAALRSHLQAGAPAVKAGAEQALLGADRVRHLAQQVIDSQLNPALGSHGGFVEIVDSVGHDLYVNMGGGCQGCGSAMATMRQGVEVAIREAVPEIGEIYDATNHAAGTNPYM
ncbi:MAG: NifU family protein [Planctomycetota bacterium]|nr:MAG: NifU family protein [Planctomycetota bacterium]